MYIHKKLTKHSQVAVERTRNMSKNLLLFSGQGSQYKGMGQELLESDSKAKEIYDIGSQILGLDLAHLCFEADEAELGLTINSQPAIFATSLVAFEAYKQSGGNFDGVMGHSLGEYAAMVAAGVVSLEDGFKIIKARALAMQRCADGQDGAMCAILSKDAIYIEEICKNVPSYATPVNYNSLAQTVVAGTNEAIDSIIAECKSNKVKAIKLGVNAAFHSKFMQPAADELRQTLETITFNKPTVEFYSNVCGGVLPLGTDMVEYLVNHLVSPVKFVDELLLAKNNGYDTFVELGPNKVLSGLVKKTIDDVAIYNIEDKKSLETFLLSL